MQAHNVFLTSRNIVKVGDFGISKVLDGTAALATTASKSAPPLPSRRENECWRSW